MIAVDSGIPVPPQNSKMGKYPWKQMKVGDSFHVECTPERRRQVQSSLASNARGHFPVRTQVTDTGIRVWRVEENPA